MCGKGLVDYGDHFTFRKQDTAMVDQVCAFFCMSFAFQPVEKEKSFNPNPPLPVF